jgi:hypothetical protein
VDGELNKTFNEHEKATTNKFSNNIDELINEMCETNKQTGKGDIGQELYIEIKDNVTQFISRYIG